MSKLMVIRIKRGTANKPALRRKRNLNAAYNFVNTILANRAHFNSFLRNRVENYTLKNNGTLKGFAILGRNKYYNFPMIDLIGTAPGRGYGTELMRRISRNARRGHHELFFVHDPVKSARAWYRNKFGARTVTKVNSGNTSIMQVPTNTLGSTATSRPPNRQRSPSRPSPRGRSSSPGSSPRRSGNGQTPRRNTPPRNSPRHS